MAVKIWFDDVMYAKILQNIGADVFFTVIETLPDFPYLKKKKKIIFFHFWP